MSSKGKRPVNNAKNKTAYSQTMDSLLSYTISIYVFAMLVIFPLYMENKYLNMGDAKYHFFTFVSLFFIGALLLMFFLYLDSHKKEAPFTKMIKASSVTDIFVFEFLIISFASFLLSASYRMAFFGYSGWYMGFLSQALFVLIFFFVSKFWTWNPTTITFAMLTGAITYFITVLQRFNLDIFELYYNHNANGDYIRLADQYIEKFVSTLGQTTWYSSYAVLILPFGMFWYAHDTKLVSRIFSAIFIALGAASLCTVNSDSAYVAIMLIFIVFFWYSLEDNTKFQHFLEIVLIFLCTFRFIGILQSLFPERMIKLLTGDEAITTFVNRSVPMLILTIIMAFIYILYRIVIITCTDTKTGKCSFDIRKFKILRSILVMLAVIVIWFTVLLIIIVTTGKLPDKFSKLSEIGFLNFTDAWGNCRGFNWRMAATAFVNSSFKDLLFGVGPDCFALSMNKYCYADVQQFYQGLQLACAHNEWLNMLITEGFLGLAAYLGIFITMCYRLGKIAYKEPMAIPCLAAIIAYIGHNFFCYQQCICTPLIFIIMGIGEMIIVKTKETRNAV